MFLSLGFTSGPPPNCYQLYILSYKLGLPYGLSERGLEVMNLWCISTAGTRLLFSTEFSVIPEIETISVSDNFHQNVRKEVAL